MEAVAEAFVQAEVSAASEAVAASAEEEALAAGRGSLIKFSQS